MAQLKILKFKNQSFNLSSDWIKAKVTIDDKEFYVGVTQEVVNYVEAFAYNLIVFKTNQRNNETYADKENSLSTAQLRNFFGEMRRIQMKEFEKNKSSFFMLKPKLAYAVARAKKKDKLELFQNVINDLLSEVDNHEEYNSFMQFVEATVAFHKAFGGE